MERNKAGGIEENHSEHRIIMVDKKYGDGITWNRGAMLGKGSFGSVYLATLKKPRSKYGWLPSVMAVKSAEVSVSGSIQKEREVLSNVKGCPNIIQCFGEETTTGDNGVMVYNLLLEYGSGGTLAEKIRKSGDKGLPELEVKSYTRSILKGLSYIHEIGYVHCDLKPDNILLVPKNDSDGCAEFRAKIGDFGLAKRVAKQCNKKRKLEPYWRGTPMYLSPEVVGDGVQELPSDVWALGCIVLEMLTGKPPWGSKEEMNSEEIIKKIGKELPQIPSGISKEAKEFLKGCFVKKAMFRLTADMLLNHSFLEGLVEDDDSFAETVMIEDISGIESILVVSETDDEISCGALSDGYSFASEDCSHSYWSEEDAEDMEDEVVSQLRQEKKLKGEENGGLMSTNTEADFDRAIQAPLQVPSPIPPKTTQQYPVSFRIPAGV